MKKHERKIFKYIKKGLALLCCAATFSLFSCVQKPPAVQNGIIVTPSVIPPYSAQTNAYAEEVTFNLLKGYFQKTVTSKLLLVQGLKNILKARRAFSIELVLKIFCLIVRDYCYTPHLLNMTARLYFLQVRQVLENRRRQTFGTVPLAQK